MNSAICLHILWAFFFKIMAYNQQFFVSIRWVYCVIGNSHIPGSFSKQRMLLWNVPNRASLPLSFRCTPASLNNSEKYHCISGCLTALPFAFLMNALMGELNIFRVFSIFVICMGTTIVNSRKHISPY